MCFSLTFIPKPLIHKTQRKSAKAQQSFLAAYLLFALTDGGKSNPILFRAAAAQNQYYIRKLDEFEICTQSGY